MHPPLQMEIRRTLYRSDGIPSLIPFRILASQNRDGKVSCSGEKGISYRILTEYAGPIDDTFPDLSKTRYVRRIQHAATLANSA